IGVIPIPDAVNVVATYPIGLVEGGDEALVTAFIAYILSAEGQVTLVEYGFSPVSAGLATPAAG
ncbi:MAG: substrate-binding domain-containing protein, partial [Chloroflexota bacterium]|nr:substrate-binding domain-containing protein [Chloroflexota bacterium]